MDETKRRVMKFLQKEIKTYTALSLFLAKNDIQVQARAGEKRLLVIPAFYRDRMQEAKKLVHELRKGK